MLKKCLCYVRFSRYVALFLVFAITIVSLVGIAKAETKADDLKPESEDTTPPAFQEGYPASWPQEEGRRMVGITILTVKQVYCHLVLLPDGAPPPSKEQVINGTDGNDNFALYSYSTSHTTTSISIQVPTGMHSKHSTDYDIYVVLQDGSGNLSEPAKVDVTSPGGAKYITGDGIRWFQETPGSKQIRVEVNLQNIEADYKGKVYWVLLPKGAQPPSIDQIAAGTDGEDNAAISMGSPEFNPLDGSGQFIVTGATGNTDYELYMVVGNTMYSNPLTICTEVQHLTVKTPEDISDDKVCEMNGIQYETLTEALNAAGSTETIKMLKNYTNIDGIAINNKHITLDLNGHILNIDTAADEGLKVTEGSISLIGNGELNVSGRLYGVYADLDSKVSVTNASAKNTIVTDSSTAIGVLALNGSKVTVNGSATGFVHGVKAENTNTEVTVFGDVSNKAQVKGAVYSVNKAMVLVKGNVTASSGYGVESFGGKIIVNKNVYGSHVGAMAGGTNPEIHIKGDLASWSNGAVVYNGIIIVDGEIKRYDSSSTPLINYIIIGSTNMAKENGVTDPTRPGYLKYSLGDNRAVWVKDPMAASIWDVSNAPELENALENFQDGDIIRLTSSIEYNKQIIIDGKTVTFDVGEHILTIRINEPSASIYGLWVKNDGHVLLNGTGEFNVWLNGSNTSTGVRVETGSSAVVTNIDVLVLTGSSFGAYADGNNAVIHVLGDIHVTGAGGCGARTWGRGRITVEGTITASAYINIGTTYKGKDMGVEDPDKPGYLKYSTPPNETGIIWVKADEIIPEYSITVQNDGHGTAASDMSSAVPGTEITLTATANSDYRFKEWQVISHNVTITNNRFIMPDSNVIVKAIFEAIPAPTFTVTVNNGTGTGSYSPGTIVTITADEAPEGCIFDKWVSDDGINFANENEATTTFVMPDKDVTITATYKEEETHEEDTEDEKEDNSEDESKDVPKTSDTNHTWVWLLLNGISAMWISLLLLIGIRKKTHLT